MFYVIIILWLLGLGVSIYAFIKGNILVGIIALVFLLCLSVYFYKRYISNSKRDCSPSALDCVDIPDIGDCFDCNL